jgi:hypothetical protein
MKEEDPHVSDDNLEDLAVSLSGPITSDFPTKFG